MKDKENGILFFLKVGKENAITRNQLVASTGYSDREVRKSIAYLREKGYPIMNDQKGSGYHISYDLDEIERQYRQDTARAMSILKRRKTLRKILKEKGRIF